MRGMSFCHLISEHLVTDYQTLIIMIYTTMTFPSDGEYTGGRKDNKFTWTSLCFADY